MHPLIIKKKGGDMKKLCFLLIAVCCFAMVNAQSNDKFNQNEEIGNEDLQNSNAIEDLSVSVYPNPTTSIIYLKLNNRAELDVKIISAKGIAQSVHLQNEGDFYSVDVSGLGPGMYAITVASEGKKFSTIFYKN